MQKMDLYTFINSSDPSATAPMAGDNGNRKIKTILASPDLTHFYKLLNDYKDEEMMEELKKKKVSKY